MDRKAKIKEYKDTPRPMGVFQIKNKVNGFLQLSGVPLAHTTAGCEVRDKWFQNHFYDSGEVA